MQPERINPELNQKGYNVKSDVWSLGITMVLSGLGAALAAPAGWGVSVLGSPGSKSFKSQKKELFLVSGGGEAPSNIPVWIRGYLEVIVPLS